MGSPLQFIICGIIQLTMDSLIVLQFIIYGGIKSLFRFYGSEPLLDEEYSQSYSSLDEVVA